MLVESVRPTLTSSNLEFVLSLKICSNGDVTRSPRTSCRSANRSKIARYTLPTLSRAPRPSLINTTVCGIGGTSIKDGTHSWYILEDKLTFVLQKRVSGNGRVEISLLF
jgi:hypothetical protein